MRPAHGLCRSRPIVKYIFDVSKKCALLGRSTLGAGLGAMRVKFFQFAELSCEAKMEWTFSAEAVQQLVGLC